MSEKRQDFTSGLLLPAGQAIVTGALFALVVLAVYYLAQGVTGWRLFGGALAVGCFAAWVFVLRKMHPARVGEAVKVKPYQADMIRVELQTQPDPYKAVEWLDLPIEREAQIRACRELVRRNYETSNLGGRGKSLSRSQAEVFRDYLLGRGLAYWVNPGAHCRGWRVSAGGRAVIRRVANCRLTDTDTPTPPGLIPAPDLFYRDMQARTSTRERRWR